MIKIFTSIKSLFSTRQILSAFLFSVVFTITNSYAQISPSDYVTIWQTDAEGDTEDNQLFFPAFGEYTIYYESIPAGTSGTLPETGTFTDAQLLTFPAPGTYRVAVKPAGSIPFHRISFNEFELDLNKIRAIEQWGTTVWSSWSFAYTGCKELTTLPETDMPDLSSVTAADWAFCYCAKLTGSSNMNDWDVSNITDMGVMFADAAIFNQPINQWDVSNVTIMNSMLSGALAFNQPIEEWDVSKVTNMESMFYYTEAFNRPIGNWDVSSVTTMSDMFSDAYGFNQPLDAWDVSGVKAMDYMFRNATTFNQPLNVWDVSAVTRMEHMFRDATSFNQPLNAWKVSAVTRMEQMFRGATSFNQPLGNWNVSNVRRVSHMFLDATSFNQPLGNWTFSSDADLNSMLNGSGIDCGNYNSTLIGWAANPATPLGRNFGADGKTYGTPAVDARNALISLGWTITGDSFDASCTSLPVKLVSFGAKKQEFSSLLTWSTTEETNSDRFEIQRSADAKNWITIGTLASGKESTALLTYQFRDHSPLKGTNYYRLRMVDKDQTFAYSRVEALKFNGGLLVSVYPNPASDILLIQNYQQVKQIEMFNAAGKKLLENKKVTAQGIDISKFLPGLHTVKIIHTDGTFQTTKLAIFR